MSGQTLFGSESYWPLSLSSLKKILALFPYSIFIPTLCRVSYWMFLLGTLSRIWRWRGGSKKKCDGSRRDAGTRIAVGWRKLMRRMVIFKKTPNIMLKNWNRTLELTWNYFYPHDYIFQIVIMISLD